MELLSVLLIIGISIYVGYYFRTKKDASKKKSIGMGCLTYFALFMVVGVIYGIVNSDELNAEAEKEKKAAEAKKEAEKEIVINTDSIIGIMKNQGYIFKKDEFDSNGSTWVYPPSYPKNRNQNAFYCYFQLDKNNKPFNFRFVIQYVNDNWLFIQNCVFNIDGEVLNYYPESVERDNAGGIIWEWCDSRIYGANPVIISKIGSAKTVKVKFNGQQYSDTRTLTASQIKWIGHMFSYYIELGGKFK